MKTDNKVGLYIILNTTKTGRSGILTSRRIENPLGMMRNWKFSHSECQKSGFLAQKNALSLSESDFWADFIVFSRQKKAVLSQKRAFLGRQRQVMDIFLRPFMAAVLFRRRVDNLAFDYRFKSLSADNCAWKQGLSKLYPHDLWIKFRYIRRKQSAW